MLETVNSEDRFRSFAPAAAEEIYQHLQYDADLAGMPYDFDSGIVDRDRVSARFSCQWLTRSGRTIVYVTATREGDGWALSHIKTHEP